MPIQQEPILSNILLLLFVMLCFIYNVLRHTLNPLNFIVLSVLSYANFIP